MNINKSQRKSITNVEIYLSNPVFLHGQLYVAMSRVKFVHGLKIIVFDYGKKLQMLPEM